MERSPFKCICKVANVGALDVGTTLLWTIQKYNAKPFLTKNSDRYFKVCLSARRLNRRFSPLTDAQWSPLP